MTRLSGIFKDRRWKRRVRPLATVALALGALLAGAGSVRPSRAATPTPPSDRDTRAAVAPPGPGAAPFADGVVLVRFRAGVSVGRRYALERSIGAAGARFLGPLTKGAQPPLELKVPKGGVLAALQRLRRLSDVAYAEPNYLMSASAVPNDPEFTKQWGDNNTGQSIPAQEANEKLGASTPGTAGADDRALKAWGVASGSASIVIGETDTGISYEHPDLAANTWANPGGIGGCAAGTHGYNVLNQTCNPLDDDTAYGGHGTHVAGIMGAVGNNGTGVVGMNWHTSILAVKWLNKEATGETSGLIEALQWLVKAKQAGVNIRVVNDSATFVGTAPSQALSEEIDTLGANGMLFVTAAGNTGQNNDEEKVRRYPCGYNRPTEICVTASNDNDQLPSWANYGSHTVDLAAPGVSIYSTLREGKYGWLSGGSMASPQVAGAAALILSVKPSLTPQELKSDILKNVDVLPSLSGKVITGGRLDVCKALPGCTSSEPPPATTFGKTSVGGSSDAFAADRKRVNEYPLSVAAKVTKLSVYLAPTSTSGQQTLEGIIYADSSGKPGALLATTSQLTFASTSSAGWYDLTFPSAVSLPAGNYWIGVITGPSSSVAGFRFDSVSGARDANPNTYASGPSNPFGSFTTDSEQMSLYATYTTSGMPVNTALPVISGTPTVGQTLSVSDGSWSENPTSYSYQWQRCTSAGEKCAAIGGANKATYLLVSADQGSTIRAQVTASNAAGPSAPASAGQTAVVQPAPPANTSPPVISGTPAVGQTISVSNGSWSENPTSYSYQWLRCNSAGEKCEEIASAKGSTYLLTGAEQGSTIRAQVTASNSAGPSAPASSTQTAVVAPEPTAPVNTALPVISGTATVGHTLSVSNGSWSESPTSYSYQWLRCNTLGEACAPIGGATKATYPLVSTDQGFTFRAEVTAANSAGPSAPATANQSAVVQPAAPANTALPVITGTSTVGQTLSVSNGSWSENPTSYSYQWLRCNSAGEKCAAIGAATNATYLLVSADQGSTIRAEVTASNRTGPSTPATSGHTGVVQPRPPANTAPPVITGTSTVGQMLSVSNGSWSENPTSYGYQWLRCNVLGEECAVITGATKATYLLVSADQGSTIRAQVTASNSAGPSTPAISNQTGVVAPALSATFGKTTVGASSDHFVAERKRVNRYALGSAGSVSKLSMYLAPTGTSGQQVLKGVIYADSSGAPAALLGTSAQLTFTGTSSAGWYDLVFSAPVKLAAGNYWIGVITGASAGVTGFRFDSVSGSRDYNSNTYSSGPTNPFGAVTTDAEQMSLYATYTPG